MKKALISTAVIFIISAVVCLCSGTALGARAIRNYAKSEHKFGAAVEQFKDTVLGYIDEVRGIEDDSDSWNELYSEQIEVDMPEGKDTLKIAADIGTVIICKTDSETITGELKVYSKRADSANNYLGLDSDESTDIILRRFEVPRGNIKAELTVYVPEAYVGSVDIDVDTGDVEVKEVKANALIIKVHTGEVELKNAAFNSADVDVTTGDVEVSKNFACEKMLNVKVKTGEISCDIPLAENYIINYNVNTGETDVEKLTSLGDLIVASRSGLNDGQFHTAGYENGNGVQIDLDVGIGTIEFD